MSKHNSDPMTAAPILRNRMAGPYVTPSRGSIHRPDFRGPQQEPVSYDISTSVHSRLAADQARREAADAADRERRAALPAPEQLLERRIAALEADCANLRVELAKLSALIQSFTPPRRAA